MADEVLSLSSRVNEYGGDADWGDAPAPTADRGDNLEPETSTTEGDTHDEGNADSGDSADADAAGDSGDQKAAGEEGGLDDDSGEAGESGEEEDRESGDSDEGTEDRGSEGDQNRVPVNRLNKEVQKRRAAEERLKDFEARVAELEERLASAQRAPSQGEGRAAPADDEPAFGLEDFKAMQDAMLDGDTEVAMSKFAEMMAKQTEKAAKLAREEARAEIDTDRVTSRLQSAAQELAAKYPELDHTSELGDQGLIEEVVELRNVYIERGQNAADALRKAVKLVALENGLEDRTAKPPKPATPPAKKVDTQSKLDIAQRERGRLPGDGEKSREQRLDIRKLSDKQFAELSREALAKARGDFV